MAKRSSSPKQPRKRPSFVSSPPDPKPVPVPKVNHLEEIRQQIRDTQAEIDQTRKRFARLGNAKQLWEMERELNQLQNRLSALYVKEAAQAMADQEQSQQARSALGRVGDQIKAQLLETQPPAKVRVRNQGKRPLTIRTEAGTVTIYASYWSRPCDREKAKKGFFPVALRLGIIGHCTPGLVLRIGKWAAMLASFEEVKEMLADRGVQMSVNKIRGIVYDLAVRMRESQKKGSLDLGDSVAGRRIVVSTDGGRLRLREGTQRVKGADGKNRIKFKTPWREPKLLSIYAVEKNGKRDKQFRVVLDGTMKGPDAIFEMIKNYLIQLNAKEASQIVFVADAATWIWNRTEELAKDVGVPADKFREVIDYYHAVEHLGALSNEMKKWNKETRKAWVNQQKGLLLKNKENEVLENIKAIAQKNKSKKIQKEYNFFNNHISRNRMKYGQLEAEGLPRGSGGMESAVRRVVNLRLKGASIYWNKTSAEAMLMLRSYYKADRWNSFEIKVLTSNLEAAA